MKRFLALIASLVLTVSLVFSGMYTCFADDGEVHDNRVVDCLDLLSEEEETALRTYLDGISEELQFEVVVVTTSDLEGKDPMDYADDYYDLHNYGYGSGNDGILFLRYLNGNEREVWISTCGSGESAINDNDIDRLFDEMTPSILAKDYYEAFSIFGKDVYELVSYYEARSSGQVDISTPDPYDHKNSGDTTYYNETSWDGYTRKGGYYTYNKLEYRLKVDHGAAACRILAGFVIGLIIAFIVGSIFKKQLRSVSVKNNANAFAVPGGLRVTRREERYIRTSVSKIPRSTESSSSGSGGHSSTHHSSSGVSHGGGGRHI